MILTFLGLLLLAGVEASSGAIILEDHEEFRVTSASSGELSVSKTIRVMDKDGLEAATFFLYCDSFRSLKSFSGSVQVGDAKPVKIKKADLYSAAYSEGLVGDGRIYAYEPSGHYPLTVKYEYRVAYQNGMASFPTFAPLTGENVTVESASYTVDVPADYTIHYFSSGAEYSLSHDEKKRRDLHTWTVEGAGPIVVENLMPDIRELIPHVYCSPERITLAGYEGTQRDWKELGEWSWKLQEGTGDLSPEEVAKVQELTANCKTDGEKLSILYNYLRDKTRYVSVQLGIGGWKPIDAKVVSHLGYGDCKGLSNYLKSLLAAVGVKSDYYIINTEKKDLMPNYASVGLMDHAMLAVPLPELSDTVWVECTNPTYPLGYRHDSCAGHEVVLIKEEGGELLRIPAYADSLTCERQYSDIVLTADGNAQMSMKRELYLDEVEPYLDFRDEREDVRKRMLNYGIKGNPYNLAVKGVTDNFQDYFTKGRDFVPEMTIDYTLESRSYATVNGTRLFIPVNPYPKLASIQKSKRKNDICLSRAMCNEDIITLHIPEGYGVESIPAAVSMDTEWGHFSSEAALSEDGKTLVIKQVVSHKPTRQPASAYSSWASFYRKVNRQYQNTIVLTLLP